MAICNYIKTTYRLIFLHSFKDGARGGEGRGAWRRKKQQTPKLNTWQQNYKFHVHGRKIDSIPVWTRKCLFFSFAFVTLYRCALVTLFPIYVDSYAEKLPLCCRKLLRQLLTRKIFLLCKETGRGVPWVIAMSSSNESRPIITTYVASRPDLQQQSWTVMPRGLLMVCANSSLIRR